MQLGQLCPPGFCQMPEAAACAGPTPAHCATSGTAQGSQANTVLGFSSSAAPEPPSSGRCLGRGDSPALTSPSSPSQPQEAHVLCRPWGNITRIAEEMVAAALSVLIPSSTSTLWLNPSVWTSWTSHLWTPVMFRFWAQIHSHCELKQSYFPYLMPCIGLQGGTSSIYTFPDTGLCVLLRRGTKTLDRHSGSLDPNVPSCRAVPGSLVRSDSGECTGWMSHMNYPVLHFCCLSALTPIAAVLQSFTRLTFKRITPATKERASQRIQVKV